MKLCADVLRSVSSVSVNRITPHLSVLSAREHVNMPKTIESPTKCEVQWYREMTFKFRETNHSKQKLLTGDFLELLDPLAKQDHSWHSLPSLTDCIMDVCTSCFKVPAPFPHSAVTYESFTICITHLSNFGCIAPLCIKKLNYSMHFTFSGRYYCFRDIYMLTMRSELTGEMWRDRRAYYRHCRKLHLIFTLVLIPWPIRPWKRKSL